MNILRIIVVGLVIFSGALAVRAGDVVSADFDSANRLYAQNQFAEAAAAYDQILTNGAVSPVLYFNQGNAYFKAGQLGRAIAAYRQAERFTPRDPDLRANLQFARNRVQGPTIKAAAWQRGLNQLSLNEWTGLAVASFWLTFALLVARQLKPALRPVLRSWTWIASVSTVLLFSLVGFAAKQSFTSPTAIVNTPDATVRTSPFDESPAAFTAHDGAELRVLDRKDDWVQVTDDDRRVGWLKRPAVEMSGRL